MKFFMLILSLLQPSQTIYASEKSIFLVRSADVSVQDYESHLKKTGSLSFLDYVKWQAENTTPQSDKLNLAIEKSFENPLQSLPLFEQALEELSQHPWGEPSKEIFVSVFEKMASLKIPTELQIRYKRQIETFQASAAKIKTPVLALEIRAFQKRIQLDSDAQVLVNGISLDQSHLNETSQFHFAVVSNSKRPLYHWGTWKSFQEQIAKTKAQEPLASGRCETQKNDQRPLELQENTGVYWGSMCDQSASAESWDSQVPKNLAEINHEPPKPKTWMWALAIVSGAILYSSFKDKEVLVEIPGLSF